ncbi:MAG: DMT family transporter [Chloroflexota bacterium]|nr:DMT family transporter [Chloroflexota bacterium]
MLASVGYGAQGILAKFAYAGGADVPTVLAVRFGVASMLVWGLLFALPRDRRPALRQSIGTTLGFGALGLLFVTNALFYFLSLALLPASTAAVLVFVFPALVVLWSVLFVGEKLTRLKVGALGLALLGCVLTVDPVAALAIGASVSWLGVLWALGSALSNSWYVVLAGIVGRGKSPLAAALYSLPVTAACFCGYLALSGGYPSGITTAGWLSCLGVGLLAGISVYLYLIGVARIGASRTAVVATTEPATAVILGALLLAEPITAVKLAGGACIAAAVVLLSHSR